MSDAESVDSQYTVAHPSPTLHRHKSFKEEAVSWTTHLVPGDMVLECVKSPGPGSYDDPDPNAIGKKGGVEFAGKGIKRELTFVDPTYKAQLSTPGIGAYDPQPVASRRGASPITSADRFYESRNLYFGHPMFALTAVEGPGPGMYGAPGSSFRGVNPYGPPHTFGATAHNPKYDTPGHGPAMYNPEKPKMNSPSFGFGAGNRGVSNKAFIGADFCQKGHLGPGPGSSGPGHRDLNPQGGVISTSKRAANEPLPFACHTPPPPPRNEAQRRAQTPVPTTKSSKDYSWLYPEGKSKESATGKGVSFGTGPRFNDCLYEPTTRSVHTDSPGPKYKLPTTLGGGPRVPFTTTKKLIPTPAEYSRRNFPGPGQYNLTKESRVEDLALQVLEVQKMDAIVNEFGEVGTRVFESVDEFLDALGLQVGWSLRNVKACQQRFAQIGVKTLDDVIDVIVTNPGKINDKLRELGSKELSQHTLSVAWEMLRGGGEDQFAGLDATDVEEQTVRASGGAAGTAAPAPPASPSSPAPGSPASPSSPGTRGVTFMTEPDAPAAVHADAPQSPGFSAADSSRSLTRSSTNPGLARSDSKRLMSPITRTEASGSFRLKSQPSQQLLRAVSSSGLRQDPIANALARSTSLHAIKPETEQPPPQPLIRPETANVDISEVASAIESRLRVTDSFRMPRTPSVKFATSNRFTEQQKLYISQAHALPSDEGAGPGAYDLNNSSFRQPNPNGPPHSFGATNHDLTYDTPGPGPLAYNAVPKPAYSPKFGFGASHRGEGNKAFAGEEFASKGTLGPGMYRVHSELKIQGGVISTSKRDVCLPLAKPAPSPFEIMNRDKKDKKRRSKRATSPSAAAAPPSSPAAGGSGGSAAAAAAAAAAK